MSISELQAIEEFVPHLRRFARALLEDAERADDLVRECLDEALLRRRRQEPVTNLRVWLFAILHQRYVRQLDASAAASAGGRDEAADDDKVLDPEIGVGFTVRDFEHAFRRLPAEAQQILLLTGLEGMSHQEVAEVLNLPLSTLMLRIWQIRKRLRTIELQSSGVPAPTVRPLLRSRILRQPGAAKPEPQRHTAAVIHLARR